LKDLGVPKIHLEFELTSNEFLSFELAEVWLNETQIIEVEDVPEPKKKEKP
jgi:hypothetical protein